MFTANGSSFSFTLCTDNTKVEILKKRKRQKNYRMTAPLADS